MKTIINPDKSDWVNVLKRPTQTVDDIEATVNQIFDDVARNGDQAISKYTEMFDGCTLNSIEVTTEETKKASALVSEELKKDIKSIKELRKRKNEKAFRDRGSGFVVVQC